MGNHRQIGVGLLGLGVIGTCVAKTLPEDVHSFGQKITGRNRPSLLKPSGRSGRDPRN